MRNNRFLNVEEDEQPMCPGCDKEIWPSERSLLALGSKYHTGCIKCTTCGITLTPRSMDTYEKKPYCRAHLPTFKATTISDDFHTKANAAKPVGDLKRQQGINKMEGTTFNTTNMTRDSAVCEVPRWDSEGGPVPDVSEPTSQAASFWSEQEKAAIDPAAAASSQHVDESLLAAKSGSGAASFWANQEKAALEPAMAGLAISSPQDDTAPHVQHDDQQHYEQHQQDDQQHYEQQQQYYDHQQEEEAPAADEWED